MPKCHFPSFIKKVTQAQLPTKKKSYSGSMIDKFLKLDPSVIMVSSQRKTPKNSLKESSARSLIKDGLILLLIFFYEFLY